MRKATVRNRQTLLDIAAQTAGTIEAVFELAAANGLSLTARLQEGAELIVPEYVAKDLAVQEDYMRKATYPVSEDNSDALSGINYEPIPTIIFV